MPVGKKRENAFVEGDGRPCALNDWLKFIFVIVNVLYCIFGIVLLGVAIQNSEEWRSLEGGTFETMINTMIGLGTTICFFVILGCLGMTHQTVREGPCRGRRLLCIFEIGVLVMLYMQFMVVIYSMNSVAGLEIVIDTLKKGGSMEYLPIEESVSRRFNDYYFGTYDDSQSDIFWRWLDSSCPSSMTSASCNSISYSSECPIQDACDSGEIDDPSCPYEICRKPAATKVHQIVSPLADYGLFLLFFEIVVIVLTCLLICYNPHDDERDLLTKAVGFDATEAMSDDNSNSHSRIGDALNMIKKKKKKKKTKQTTESRDFEV